MMNLGRYEILAELGRGAMGTVYQARDPRIGRTVALKTISISASTPQEDNEYRERFFREAQAAGKLAHPGIVTIFDVGEDEASRTPFIVMEYIAGQTLDKLAPLDPPQALELIRQVAEALDYAHAQGIVHRDVKPANILVTEEGRAKITDFGIAKLTVSEFTQAGQVLGTPSYMAPEQLTGEKIDGRADLFSLGIVLYILLTGKNPFAGESLTQITFKLAYQQHAPASQASAAITADTDYVISRALAKSPADRYQSGREFAADLEDLSKGLPPRSRKAQGAGARKVISDGATTAVLGARAMPDLPHRISKRTLVLIAGLAALLVVVSLLFTQYHPQAPIVEQAPVPEVEPAGGAVNSNGSDTAMLRVRGVHPFYRAELSIYLDNELLQTTTLHGGGVRKKYFGMKKIELEGSFDQSFPVPTGNHTVRVQVTSSSGLDEAQEITGDFSPAAEKTLHVSFRGREMKLEW